MQPNRSIKGTYIQHEIYLGDGSSTSGRHGGFDSVVICNGVVFYENPSLAPTSFCLHDQEPLPRTPCTCFACVLRYE